MEPKDFLEQTEVTKVIADLESFISKQKKEGGWQISDVIDPETGHQYVDLVMEGGGMLGIALVGYVYALESAGIRFLRLGGTSAGAINTILLASGDRSEASTDWLVDKLANKNFYEFVDGDSDARDFIDTMLKSDTESDIPVLGRLKNWAGLANKVSKSIQVIDNLQERQGLNPGDAFTEWLREILKERGISNLNDLKKKRKKHPKLELRDGQPFSYNADDDVAFVAADLSTQTKVIFPRMANFYWSKPNTVHPAEMVRASMSIPIFFEPYKVKDIPGSGGVQPNPEKSEHRTIAGRASLVNENPALQRWQEIDYMGPIPKEASFSDGGIISNFPIDLFHVHNKSPKAPTLGVKLGFDRNREQKTDSIFSYLLAVFDTARTQNDFDFISKNPDYKQLVYCLDIRGYNWIDFNMSDEDKKSLFAVGVNGGVNFLKSFNWKDYKAMREHKAQLRNFIKENPTLKNPSDDPAST